MEKRIILTEEEYNSLLENKKEGITISKENFDELEAAYYTLFALYNPLMICPKCKRAYLVSGYLCPCCRYDCSSDYNEEDLDF